MISRNTFLSAWLFLSTIAPGFAAEAGKPSRIPDRYLLIMDISSPMRTRADAVQKSVAGLLVSGMQGQLREGDQLGVWTFSDQLHTGEFELVVWEENARNEITRGVLEFLDKQRYRGTTDFSKVMPDLMDVVAGSRRITVILFSDGDEVVQGTPFDDAITKYFLENADTLKQKQAPIVVVMRGYKGHLMAHTISYPPWPVEFPEFPPEPEPAPPTVRTNIVATEPDLSRTLVTTRRGPIVFAEPLIVSGRDEQSAQTANGEAGSMEGEALPDAGTSAPAGVSDEASAPDEGFKDGPSATPSVSTAASDVMAESDPTEGQTGAGAGILGLAKLLAIALVALLIISGGVLFWQRSRARQPASLITRSMNRGADRQRRARRS